MDFQLNSFSLFFLLVSDSVVACDDSRLATKVSYCLCPSFSAFCSDSTTVGSTMSREDLWSLPEMDFPIRR